MLQIFQDLLQTPSVMIPLFLGYLVASGAVVLSAYALYDWWKSRRQGSNTADHDLDEAFEQQRQLRSVYETGELPKARMANLERGSDASTQEPVDYKAIGAQYDFVIDTHDDGSLVAIDLRFHQLPGEKRLHGLDADLRFASAEEWHKKLRRLRFNALRRAQNAGLVPVGPSRRKREVIAA